MRLPHAHWSIALVAVALSLGGMICVSDAGARTVAHTNARPPADEVRAASHCPGDLRQAPKPKPRPAPAPVRERPPSSLPCCNGADCTCAGPPALAALPVEAPRPASTPAPTA
jgi:hypothetical protein